MSWKGDAKIPQSGGKNETEAFFLQPMGVGRAGVFREVDLPLLSDSRTLLQDLPSLQVLCFMPKSLMMTHANLQFFRLNLAHVGAHLGQGWKGHLGVTSAPNVGEFDQVGTVVKRPGFGRQASTRSLLFFNSIQAHERTVAKNI